MNKDDSIFSKFWQPRQFSGVDLLHARYRAQVFSRHSHEGFAVGVIENGVLAFDYRGSAWKAAAGAINLAIPDQAHDGHAVAEEGWSYRMFYLEEAVLCQAVSQMHEGHNHLPFFPAGVLQDPNLAQQLLTLHHQLEDPVTGCLEGETNLLTTLIELIRRYATDAPAINEPGREHAAVRRARILLDECCQDDISLAQLAHCAGLSPFHLLRVFQHSTGLTPHGYLIQARIRKARQLLASGNSPAAVAADTGFADQSHLNRHFKRTLGITPGQYRKIVQDRRT